MAIYIKRGKGNCIEIRFEYSLEKIKKIKLIKGYKWNGEEKYWSIPYSSEAYKSLTKLFCEEEMVNQNNKETSAKENLYSSDTLEALEEALV